MASDSTIDEMNNIIRANVRLHNTITSFEININRSNKTKITKGFLDARRKVIDDYWGRFQKDHETILDNIEF